VSSGSIAQEISDRQKNGRKRSRKAARAGTFTVFTRATTHRVLFHVSRHGAEALSSWSQSGAKRVFDCLCVFLMLPLILPLVLIVAVLVRLTSSGPVFFLQERVGCGGRSFTVFKFRTILHGPHACCHAVSTLENQPFTSVGPFLRRWKLDELPQVFNVLLGHMSLIGPRPKMPEHVKVELRCRPGITGAATIAFACEERVLDCIPRQYLNTYYHQVILPAKQRLDDAYMAHATFLSDLRLIVNSILRRWDGSVIDALLERRRAEEEEVQQTVKVRLEESAPIDSAVAESIQS